MSINGELREMSEKPVVAIRTRTTLENLPKVIGESYQRIMAHLQKSGIEPAGAPYTAYFNLDMQDLDIEMGFPVPEAPGTPAVAEAGDIRPGVMAAGKYASYLYTGPYSEMGPVYEGLDKWIKGNGYEMHPPYYEFYFNSPADTPQEKLQTQILLPVK